MNHNARDYATLYDASLEALLSHKIPPPAVQCARIILNHSFRRGRPVAVIPRLAYLAARIGLDKSNTRAWLVWLDVAGIARCHTDRGVYLFKPDDRQWDTTLAPLCFDQALDQQDEFADFFDPTLDEALAAVSRQAVLDKLQAVAGAVTCAADGASARSAVREEVAADNSAQVIHNDRGRAGHGGVAGPATLGEFPQKNAVAGPATLVVNNSSSGEPENRRTGNREPVLTEVLLEPVSVAGPATLDRELAEVIRRIRRVAGTEETARNRGRWIKAFREHAPELLLAIESTELQSAIGFRRSGAAFLNHRFNDLVAGRAPKWKRSAQQQPERKPK
jgi:hypothetical protein